MNFKRFVLTGLLGMFTLASVFCSLAAQGTPLPVENIPQCPLKYPADGMLLTKVPQGWRGQVDYKFDLQHASVIEGAPEERGELIPYEQKVKGGVEADYNDLDVNTKYEKWLSCGYGKLGEIKLYKRLPPGIKRCTMKYKPDVTPKSYILESINCR